MPYIMPGQFDIDELSATDFLMGFSKHGRMIAVPAGGLAGGVTPALREDNTAAQNGTLLAAAVAEAQRTNGYVKLPAGRYPMQCSLTSGCVIEFSPSTVLLQPENAAVLDIDLSGSALGPHTITALAVAENAASSGASTNKVLRLTMAEADASNYRTGDAIMVCSRNARSYYTGDTNYAGEMFRVLSVELNGASSYVYLNGQGYLNAASLYSDTPVAYRLARGQPVRLVRPQVEADGDVYDQSLTGSWPGSIQIKAAADVQIDDIRVNSAWGIGLYLKSCADAKIRVDRITDCPGDPGDSRFGYGILLRGACSNALVYGGYIDRCRHAFTTDCREASAWSAANVWDHGDCTNCTVVGVVSVANGAPPFDTHENSVGTTFRNCVAIGAHYAMTGVTAANGYGFNLRGPYDSVIDCRAVDCEGGASVAATGLIHEIVGDNVIDGLEVLQEATNNLAGYAIQIDGNASESTPQRVSIRNLKPARGSRGVIVGANYGGRVSIEYSTFRGFVDTALRIQGSCTVDVFASMFDMAEGGASELLISVDNSNTVALNLINVAVRSRSSSSATVLVTTASGATSNIRHYGCVEVNGANLSGGISGGTGTNNETAITALA
jgi:hypothetical protein